MIQDRHEARTAAVAAAEEAAIVVLPAAARRDILERAGSIGATVEILAGGGELRLVVPLPPSSRPTRPRRTRRAHERRGAGAPRAGPGILETSIVLGGSILLAARDHLCSSAASSPTTIGVLVDAAHGGR